MKNTCKIVNTLILRSVDKAKTFFNEIGKTVTRMEVQNYSFNKAEIIFVYQEK